MKYIDKYFDAAKQLLDKIDKKDIKKILEILVKVKEKNARLFIIGVGGGAGNAGHAVNDFRKIAGIETYAPTDNVSELTARANDDGWDSVFVSWLKTSKLSKDDCVFVFSVGGGDAQRKISNNIVEALKYAKDVGSKIIGIVGRNGGFTAEVADAIVLIPVVNEDLTTPLTESFQAVVWHLLVSHPLLKSNEMKWESIK